MAPDSKSSAIVRDLLTASRCLENMSESPRLDAELILAHALNVSRAWLFAHDLDDVGIEQAAKFRHLLERRASGEPVAYITGKKTFWDMELVVSPATLIPRPETESMIESILSTCRGEQLDVVDLGTGTGAIAIALARSRPHWNITATDISKDTLAIATRNAKQWAPQIRLLEQDWLAGAAEASFDLVVTNPPYVAEGDSHLASLTFEPMAALVAKNQGLAAIERIVVESKRALKTSGWLFTEHGYDQQEDVVRLFECEGFTDVICGHDLSGQPRFVGGKK